jgi:integrase
VAFRIVHPRSIRPSVCILLESLPPPLKGKRDRAILATFLHHRLRCEELCGLRVRDLQSRQGVPHLRIFGKGAKVRYVPAHPLALERIHDYFEAAGHGEDADGPLFRPLKNPAGKEDTKRPLTHGAVYHRVLRKHAQAAGIDSISFGPHALRATAATNALDRGADLAQGPGMALATPTRRPPASTTGAAPVPRTAPPSGWGMDNGDSQSTSNGV